MKKMQTSSLLQDYLDEESAWRIKEISDLKIGVRTAEGARKRTLIRASVPLIYAHWEGFVKNVSTAYVNFVNCQRLNYEQLRTCFVVFGLKGKLNDLTGSRQAKRNNEIINFLFNELKGKAKLNLSNAIDTESNLNSEVFGNIAESIGIDPSPYESKYNFIDISLVKRRNDIAHGQSLDLDADDCRKLADEVIFLIRRYKTDIENAVALKEYLKTI
jgi:hypothetical protein